MCSDCDKPFTCKYHLTHMRIHTKEKCPRNVLEKIFEDKFSRTSRTVATLPEIVWLRKWFIEPEINEEETKCLPLYIVIAAAEALASQCQVLNGFWGEFMLEFASNF